MIAYRIHVVRDTATPLTRALRAGLAPAVINPVVGRAAAEATRAHYIQLNRERPNHLGGKRTNYYLGAAKSTSFTIVDDGVIVSVRQIGLRLKYYGGKVTAGKGVSSFSGKPTKFLTIPVHPRAHGKRASEFDLELVYNHDGVPVALATKSTRGFGELGSKHLSGRRGEIMYLLKRSVMVKADPSILPAPDRIYGAALSSLNAHVDRLIARANKDSA